MRALTTPPSTPTTFSIVTNDHAIVAMPFSMIISPRKCFNLSAQILDTHSIHRANKREFLCSDQLRRKMHEKNVTSMRMLRRTLAPLASCQRATAKTPRPNPACGRIKRSPFAALWAARPELLGERSCRCEDACVIRSSFKNRVKRSSQEGDNEAWNHDP